MYKRKAPATPSLSPLQQLGKMCNACLGDLPFQVHHAVALQRQMQRSDAAVHAQFAERATLQRFVPRRLVDAGTARVRDGAVLFTLPLPRYFIDADDGTDSYTPRAFYHASALEEASSSSSSKGKGKSKDSNGEAGALAEVQQQRAPRCGHTGLFYTREEVVDNLCAAAADMSFQSPFWLRSDHPALASGFLKVKDDSEAVCIGLSASVVSIAAVEAFDTQLLHPSLRGSGQALRADLDALPRGMNALSGFVTRNPYVQSMPQHGVWLSLDQLLHYNIALRPPSRDAEAPTMVLAEVDKWELYNADQLVTPGRLALRQCVSSSSSAASGSGGGDGAVVFQLM